MNNNYIPEIFKEKIYQMFKYIYSLSLFLVSVSSLLALLTFDINDNSFLTNTSNVTQNLLGNFGSYFASFIFYTFGVLGYLVIVFFLTSSVLIILKKTPKYIFIRLLLFFISLIIIPQTFIYYEIDFKFIETIKVWGIFAEDLYFMHKHNYLSYVLSVLGIVIFLFSQNIFSLFAISKLNVSKIFRYDANQSNSFKKVKKEPLINTMSSFLINFPINFSLPSFSLIAQYSISSVMILFLAKYS